MTFTPSFFARLLALLLGLFVGASTSQAADPLARAALQSKGTLYVGQEVLVDIDVLVPNYFLQPPQFPPIDLPGAIVTLQDGQALNLNETIEGTAYSGIRRTYVVTPQRAGAFALPPAEIPFGYAAVPGQVSQGRVTIPPLRFSVQAAPGVEGGPGVVAAKVSVTQELDQDPSKLSAGDTLVRTITVRAEGMRAMMIPEPDLVAPDGVRIYHRDPSLSDETDRNGQAVAGIRKDVVSYLFADPGTYVLQAIELSWFDPATEKTQSAGTPEVTVTVAPALASPPAIAPPASPSDEPPFDWLRLGTVVVGALATGLVLALLARGLSRLEARWAERRSQQRQSEEAYFRHVVDACNDGSAAGIGKAIDAWSRKAGIAPLQSWLGRFADADTLTAYNAHLQAIYGVPTGREPLATTTVLLSGLGKARNAWLAAAGKNGKAHQSPALPPLNPVEHARPDVETVQ
ncbi:BatD family protein [Mycoplana rhizolycopersici]|uniref:BatD family protein n=1 Tax=Mycoplana rhizolycopersici TaxID=2746702 RepID=A0ABX2QEJ5_9HYPH|nr:BatD family protein [Rhizobium rhizolycopersici]